MAWAIPEGEWRRGGRMAYTHRGEEVAARIQDVRLRHDLDFVKRQVGPWKVPSIGWTPQPVVTVVHDETNQLRTLSDKELRTAKHLDGRGVAHGQVSGNGESQASAETRQGVPQFKSEDLGTRSYQPYRPGQMLAVPEGRTYRIGRVTAVEHETRPSTAPAVQTTVAMRPDADRTLRQGPAPRVGGEMVLDEGHHRRTLDPDTAKQAVMLPSQMKGLDTERMQRWQRVEPTDVGRFVVMRDQSTGGSGKPTYDFAQITSATPAKIDGHAGTFYTFQSADGSWSSNGWSTEKASSLKHVRVVPERVTAPEVAALRGEATKQAHAPSKGKGKAAEQQQQQATGVSVATS
jgi:hypothetical protein